MTKKVNGDLIAGSWFERDTTILHVVATDAAFETQLIGGVAEQIMRVIQTRGTVLGYTVVSATTAAYMIGHAGGAFTNLDGTLDTAIIDELEAAINGIEDLATKNAAVSAYAGFVGEPTTEIEAAL